MKKIKYKLIMCLVLTSFISIFILSCYNIMDTIHKDKIALEEYRSTLFEQFDRSIKLEVETAYSLVEDVYNQQQKGLLTEVDAKKRAADLVRNLRFDNGNYFWIDTTEGINVVLLGRDTEGKSRTDLVDARGKKIVLDFMEKGPQPGGGYTDYAFPKPGEKQESPKRSYVLSFKPYNWIIGTGSWVDEIDTFAAAKAAEHKKKLWISIIYSVGIGLVGLALSALFAIYLSKKISEPIVAVVASVQQIAEGNLSAEDLKIDAKDEIGILAQDFNIMKTTLKNLIKQVVMMAKHVADSSEELIATSEQTAMASTQVASSITEVAQDTEKQVAEVSQTVMVTDQIIENIRRVADGVDSATEVFNKTAVASKAGEKAIDIAINQMNSIEKTVVDSAGMVIKLGDRSKEIGLIVNTISAIAGQTNLLALNAAIEAARAGEQGKGFAVVAEEVRKLAEQSQEASKQISDLISEIQIDTDKAVVAMEVGTREVKTGTEVVSSASQTFAEISSLINQVSIEIGEVSANVQQLDGGSQKFVSAIHRIGDVTKNTAKQTHTVSAATQEQSAAMEEIAAFSHELAKLASDLQTEMNKFRV